MLPDFRSRLARAGANPWLLLTLTVLCWGGNVVAARVAVGEISPMVLVCLRWAVVTLVIGFIGRKRVLDDLRALRSHWLFVLAMGTTGFTLSNSMLFIGARSTSGINIAIIQGTMPVFVLIGAKLVYGYRIGFVRGLCACITFLGILVVAGQGDLTSLGGLEINRGDLIATGGCALYAVFTLALRKRPPVSAFGFFVGIAFAAFVTSIPAMGVEYALGAAQWPGWTGLLVLLYVAIFTSLLGQIFFIRAVELIGPARAGPFQNAVPVVGALLAVALLREQFHLYHAVALTLVIGGIVGAERLGRR